MKYKSKPQWNTTSYGHNKYTENNKYGKFVEQLEPSYNADRNVKWCSYCGKNVC